MGDRNRLLRDVKLRIREWPGLRTLVRIRYAWRTKRNLARNSARGASRCLEIGAGGDRNPGFETLDIDGLHGADYVLDSSRPLPFPDGTFELIYASHVLEHVAWYQISAVVSEWVRVLKPGGALEIWVPNGLRICAALVDYEREGAETYLKDGWFRMNPDRSPYLWASGRIFTYGDGTGRRDHPNWHRALFTPRYLQEVLLDAGLTEVRSMDSSEVRGSDHGWINLGACGTKP